MSESNFVNGKTEGGDARKSSEDEPQATQEFRGDR